MTDKDKRKMLTAALVVAVIIIILLLLRKWPKGIGTITPPTIGINIPEFPPFELPPIDIDYTNNPQPTNTCGCSDNGLLPDFQRLLDVYTEGLGNIIQKQFDLTMANLPPFISQFVRTASDTTMAYTRAPNG